MWFVWFLLLVWSDVYVYKSCRYTACYTKDSRFIIAFISTIAGVVVVVCYTQHSSIVDTLHSPQQASSLLRFRLTENIT